ncbi:hypothetical protein Slin15195_G092960 [Septoria linicola]|uniref:Rhodopsin domain-containing protein n=1 Tax=Septoria linicola TaxID=215465 RepID=A0A9Q9B207_9PEZI|nr:hypothetical protein Slin14017_G056080 [Septoria linicola]USW55977.1 hypothetical protein Slin15195_G092960 [Septoria linicola]
MQTDSMRLDALDSGGTILEPQLLTVDTGICNNINAQGWTSAAFNVILDVLTLGLPLPMLWKMTLNKRKKFLVLLMFSVGFFVTVVSILRLQVLVEFGDSQNLTWDYRAVEYWSTIEIHAAVICACMPSIRNLIRRFLPRLVGSSVERSTNLGPLTGRSAKSDTESGLKMPRPQVLARRRESDEQDFIPLRDVHAESVSRDAKQPLGHHARISEFTFFEDSKSESIQDRPVSPLDYRK